MSYHNALEEARDLCDLLSDSYTKPIMDGVPLLMTRTHHWRECQECRGAGVVTINRSFYCDPQYDEDVPCPNPDCVDGDISVWTDPLVLLKSARRRAFSVPYGAMYYGGLRQEAMSPVSLPQDRAPVALGRAA